jgi:hypothetical protein
MRESTAGNVVLKEQGGQGDKETKVSLVVRALAGSGT